MILSFSRNLNKILPIILSKQFKLNYKKHTINFASESYCKRSWDKNVILVLVYMYSEFTVR